MADSTPPCIRECLCRNGEGDVFAQPWGQIVWSVSGKLGNSTTMTFGRVSLGSGEQTPRHRHPNCDEILHVIAGSIEHSLGDERVVMQVGDTISIPAGTWHHAQVIGPDAADLMICFSSPDRQTEFEAEAK